MKNLMKFFILVSIPLLTLTSCSSDDDSMMGNSEDSIATIVTNNPDFSLLEAAVVRAGLVETLSGNGTFTVFAPDNDAFAAAGLGTESAINAMPVEILRSVLLYHVLGQEIMSNVIPMGTTELSTVNEAKAYVTKNANGVFVNGAAVTMADVNASNGVVHVINKVLMPPTGNIVQTAQANPDLSYLVAAVVHASSGSVDFAAVLSSNGPYTVFAPTNQAFQNAGFLTVEDIEAMDPDVLAGILTYHVLQARVFSSDLSEGLMPVTLNGGTLTITLAGGAKVKGNSNPVASNIILTDMVTTNGVVHVTDQVLLP